MTSGRIIDYEALAQEAMRGLVRQVLARTAKAGGLPGEHHFYISFDTQNPGVVLSKRLREKYPEEMTIVLQHRFWDLTVTDDRFEVKLTFDAVPERLVIPFAAIKVFFDPSVRYGLQFEDADSAQDGPGSRQAGFGAGRGFTSAGGDSDRSSPAQRGAPQRKRPQRKPRLDAVEPTEPPRAPVQSGEKSGAQGTEAEAGNGRSSAPVTPPASVPATPRPELKPVPTPAPSGAQIVSLNDFRKK